MIFYLLLKKADEKYLFLKQKSLLRIFPKFLKNRLKYSHVEKLNDIICLSSFCPDYRQNLQAQENVIFKNFVYCR